MPDTLYAYCTECGSEFTSNNSCLNRARLAAWKTQHQHPDLARGSDTPVTAYKL